jgi:hypothetical protein
MLVLASSASRGILATTFLGRVPPDAVEARLATLERECKQLRDDFDVLRKSAKELETKLHGEIQQRAAALSTLRGELRQLTATGAPAETIGIIWALAGTCLSAFPDGASAGIESLLR